MRPSVFVFNGSRYRHGRRVGAAIALAAVVLLPAAADAALLVEEFPTSSSGSRPAGLTVGADGNVWFVEQFGNRVGRADPSTGSVDTWPIPTAGSAPVGIVAGPDGNLWFTESSGNKIAAINTSGQFIHEYTVPTANSFPHAIVVGPDNNLWFTERGSSKIGRVTVGGTFTEFSLARGRQPDVITVGPDNNLWFTEQAGKIGRITPAGVVTEFPLAADSCPHGIVAGPDSRIWFTESPGRCDSNPKNDRNDKIGRLDINGTNLAEYPLPTGVDPHNIIVGPDNNMAFTEKAGNAIGRMTTAGVIIEHTPVLSSASQPGNLVSHAASGRIWFGELATGMLGRLTL